VGLTLHSFFYVFWGMIEEVVNLKTTGFCNDFFDKSGAICAAACQKRAA